MTWKYIAGFFDGEGSITHNKKGYRITISQTNKEVLNNIKNYTGVGNIFKNSKRRSHWKDSWVYYIAKQSDVFLFLKNILPYLIIKKNEANKTLPDLESSVNRINKKIRERRIRIKKVKKLREQGLSYRQIGERLNIDYGYARRLILDID